MLMTKQLIFDLLNYLDNFFINFNFIDKNKFQRPSYARNYNQYSSLDGANFFYSFSYYYL